MPKSDSETRQQRKDRVWLWVKKHLNGVTEAELANFTRIESRTVNNYLRELEREGKIYKDKTLWFSLDFDGTRLRAFELSPEEAYTLYLATRLLVKQQDKRNEPAETALLKLANVLTSDARVGHEIEQAARELAQRPFDANYHSVFRTMVQGYIYRRKIAIRYKPLNGKAFDTTFETYLMEPSAIGYATYAIGYSSSPGELRSYKLERIEAAQLVKEEYKVPSSFPGLEILRNAWSIITGEETVKVVLRFSPRVKERVKETQWHPSQEDEPDLEKPDHLRWWVWVADTMDMTPWIRSWGADVEVLEPKPLRETLTGEAKAMAEMYGWFVSSSTSSRPTLADTFIEFFGE